MAVNVQVVWVYVVPAYRIADIAEGEGNLAGRVTVAFEEAVVELEIALVVLLAQPRCAGLRCQQDP